MKNVLFKLLCLVLIASACSKDDDSDNNQQPNNDPELITTLRMKLMPNGGGPEITFTSIDMDGTGPTPATVYHEPLERFEQYTATLEFFNQSKDPATDLTNEIKSKGAEYQVFFSFSGDATVDTEYQDADTDGNPIGLRSEIEHISGSAGQMKIILRHKPNKAGNLVKEGIITSAGGTTDFETNFPVFFQ